MNLNTVPTKGNLMSAKSSLALARQGYELMDKKRNILVREIMDLNDQAKAIQSEIDETFKSAYIALEKANIELGIKNVETFAFNVTPENDIRIKTRSIMGTEIPLVKYKEEKRNPVYSFFGTTESLDQAKASFEKVKDLTIKLSMIENSAYRLAYNIKKTQKRANALKNITIPNYEALVKTIENALGGILFIDEAYALAANSNSSKGYGQEAIVELLKCMEDYQDRLVIIFAGYHDEMNDFVSLNPGLKSRIRYYFEFEDYNEDELIQILYMKLKKLNLTIDDEAVRTLKRTISFNMKATNFGNGRYVDNLVNNLLIKHSINIPDDDDTNLLNITLNDVNDLSETNDINIDDIFKELDKLIGLSNIKDELRQLVDYLQYNKKLEKMNIYPKNLNLHMVFSGNAGTGKTTVARLLSSIFYNLGYIPENRLTEITAKDLTGEYTGQTAPKVKRQVENALGGVLFIDEAYSLMQNSSSGYGQEAIAELLVGMEKYYDRLIIVFSGYEKEMKDFINVNPGLKSRIGKSFVFEDYTIDELTDILVKFVNDNKLKITDKALDKFKELVKISMKTKNFGNARWVRNSFDKILLKHSTNTKNSDSAEELITITENDIDIEEMKKSQNTTKSKLGFDLEVKSYNLEKENDNANLFFEEIESIEEEL